MSEPVWTTDVRRRAVQSLDRDDFTVAEIAHAMHMDEAKVSAILDEVYQADEPLSAFDV
jgi:hypothetical protein